VDIGDGRQMYLECRGVGFPTVVLIAGGFEAGFMWTYALDLADPIHAATEDVFPVGADLQKRETAVFPAVSKFTRVCLYDRPNTVVGENIAEERNGQISTPVPQPHPLENDVADLHALLTAAGEPGPYVLATHSYGGLIAELYARRYPKDIAGQVLVDVTSVYLKETLTPQEYDELNAAVSVPPFPGSETFGFDEAFAAIRAAPPAPQIPAVVLTADKLGKGLLPTRKAELLEAHNRLAAQLGAKHITDTNSGHHIHVEQPQLVTDAIREVVDAVRSESWQPAR
jgi:pimeloyl-ACP methyl ester carboxylesterase